MSLSQCPDYGVEVLSKDARDKYEAHREAADAVRARAEIQESRPRARIMVRDAIHYEDLAAKIYWNAQAAHYRALHGGKNYYQD